MLRGVSWSLQEVLVGSVLLWVLSSGGLCPLVASVLGVSAQSGFELQQEKQTSRGVFMVPMQVFINLGQFITCFRDSWCSHLPVLWGHQGTSSVSALPERCRLHGVARFHNS